MVASWLHDLLAGLGDWIIALVGWHLDALPLLTRQDVVASIALVVDVFGSHEGSHAAVFVVLGQLVSIAGLVVVQVQQVVSCAALIFLARVELILFDFKSLSLFDILRLHVFKSVDLSGVALFAQMSPSILHMLELLLAYFLVSHCKILVESFLL